jgi:hypothetical protein
VVLPLAALATAVLLLLWDVGLAGRLARVAEAPRSWATLTAVTGLLLLPAVLIRVLGASLVDGRTVSALGWLWPVVLTLATLQAGLTLSKGLGARTLVTPILVYNGIVTVSAWIEFAAGRGVLLPSVLHAMPTALAGAIGYLAGPAALWSPLAFAPPLIAPAYRARWAVNATVRGAVALYALATIVAFSSELPQAIRGVQSFTQWTLAPLRERPADTPLLIGARILPVVRGTPSPVALRYDTDLIDSADVNVIAVTVAPAGATPRALDSLARTLESYRADSALLAVTIGWDALEMLRARFAPTAWERDRLSVVDQVMRRLRPDVLIPVSDPLGRGAQVVGQRSVRAWVPTLTAAARTAHVVRPRTRVLVEVSTFDTRDSVMVAWATQAGSGQDGVAYMLQPGFRGGVTLEARMQAIDRWRRLRQVQRPGASALEWVTLAGGFPWTQGEVAQDRAVWGVLAWASARPGIGAVLVGDGGDYDTRRGLRGPGGRLRIATTSLRRAARSLRDAAR